jgi:hypothetical protein
LYTYEYTRTVAGRSPQECFDVVTDPSLGAEWVSMASEVRAEGEPGVGRKIISKAGLMGVHLEVPAVVHVYDEPTRYGWKSEKPVYSAFEFTFTPEGDDTRMDAKVDFDPGKIFKLGTGKVAAKKFGSDFDHDLDRLVALIQAR